MIAVRIIFNFICWSIKGLAEAIFILLVILMLPVWGPIFAVMYAYADTKEKDYVHGKKWYFDFMNKPSNQLDEKSK